MDTNLMETRPEINSLGGKRKVIASYRTRTVVKRKK